MTSLHPPSSLILPASAMVHYDQKRPCDAARDDRGEEEIEYDVGLVRLEAYCANQKLLIQQWLDIQRARVDRRAERHRLLVNGEMKILEGAHRTLQALELDVGNTERDDEWVRLEGCDDGNADKVGIGGGKSHYEEERGLIQHDIDRLQLMMEEKKAEIQGACDLALVSLLLLESSYSNQLPFSHHWLLTALKGAIQAKKEAVESEAEWKHELVQSKLQAERELENCANKYRNLGLEFERDGAHDGVSVEKTRPDALRYVPPL
jgi:hypothetical protein